MAVIRGHLTRKNFDKVECGDIVSYGKDHFIVQKIDNTFIHNHKYIRLFGVVGFGKYGERIEIDVLKEDL